VGLSRSQFAERFAAVVGRPPLAYLADWRMHRGRALLRGGGLRVGEVARRVGYGSEAAFSTAFRRAAGVAPGAYRRAAAG
jgi:AraC-like DNA-binding protein